MAKDSIKYYLTTSGAYLGVKASERWKVYEDGHIKQTAVKDDKGQTKMLTVEKFDRCMCFDYEMLKEKFDLNLESFTEDYANRRVEKEEEEENMHFAKKREPELF